MAPPLTPPGRRLRRVTSAPTTLATSSRTSAGSSSGWVPWFIGSKGRSPRFSGSVCCSFMRRIVARLTDDAICAWYRSACRRGIGVRTRVQDSKNRRTSSWLACIRLHAIAQSRETLLHRCAGHLSVAGLGLSTGAGLRLGWERAIVFVNIVHRAASASRGTRQSGCPRDESNVRTRFRKPMLYPLSYGGRAPGAEEEESVTTSSLSASWRIQSSERGLGRDGAERRSPLNGCIRLVGSRLKRSESSMCRSSGPVKIGPRPGGAAVGFSSRPWPSPAPRSCPRQRRGPPPRESNGGR